MTSIDDWIAAREVARCSVLVVLHGDGFQEGVGILFHLDTGRGIRAHFGKTLYAHGGTRDFPSNTKQQINQTMLFTILFTREAMESAMATVATARAMGDAATPKQVEIKMVSLFLALVHHFLAFDVRTACNFKTSFRNF